MGLRETILSSRNARKRITVDVAEMGGKLTLAELDGIGRERMERCATREDGRGFEVLLVALSLIDPDTGACVFSADKPEDIQGLAGVPATALRTLFDAAYELNQLSGRAVVEARKNS